MQRLNSSRIKKSTQLARREGRDLWLSDDPGVYGNGRLVLRISANGSQRFYYRPPRTAGETRTIPLGIYSRTTQPGHLTITQAREKASKLAESHRTASLYDLAETLATERLPLATVSPAGRPRLTTTRSEDLPLIQLCRDYAQHLKEAGKASAREVEQFFERFIAPSELANQPARQITPTAFADILRGVISTASGRSAGKMRSHLHAAYARAIKAGLDPASPKSQLDYGIESNPISGIDTLAQYKKARSRYLRDSEFGEVWRRLQSTTRLTIPRRGLRLCILLGGQRAEQVVSIKTTNVDLEAGTVLLFDGKGQREEPRQHLLPLLPQALEEVRWLVSYASSVDSPYLLPGSRQGTALNANSISKEVLLIRRNMEEEGPSLEHFAFIDFRRTIETKLASLGVSKDHRAQLQSHGLSGIQNKHYDRHDYMPEKRAALALWHVYLDSLTVELPAKTN